MIVPPATSGSLHGGVHCLCTLGVAVHIRVGDDVAGTSLRDDRAGLAATTARGGNAFSTMEPAPFSMSLSTSKGLVDMPPAAT